MVREIKTRLLLPVVLATLIDLEDYKVVEEERELREEELLEEMTRMDSSDMMRAKSH